jgi:hypothetical protein
MADPVSWLMIGRGWEVENVAQIVEGQITLNR